MEQNLLNVLDPNILKRCVFVYGSSYFGVSQEEEWVNEENTPHPIGIGPYFEPCIRALQAKGLEYVVAFPGGVYGRGSWFLEFYLESLRNGQPIPMPQQPPIWPYIHVNDCARAIVHLLTVDRQLLQKYGRQVIIVDDNPIPIDVFLKHLGVAVGQQPQISWLDETTLQQQLNPIAFAYQTANMRHSNARLKHLGFTLQYPQVQKGLASLALSDL
jgi:nucleoside-diphosphate-sugar epimerase